MAEAQLLVIRKMKEVSKCVCVVVTECYMDVCRYVVCVAIGMFSSP